MLSRIANAIQLLHQPVAIIWSDEKPEEAQTFKDKSWGCTLWLTAAAAKGKVTACSRDSFGCVGGGTGVGFGDQYPNFPGGTDGFCRFLSSGNAGHPQGEEVVKGLKTFVDDSFIDEYLQGERYLKDPQAASDFIDQLPIRDVPTDYILYKPLSLVDPDQDTPVSVVFFCDPDQFSALGVLANYCFDGNENVIFPFSAGCQAIGIYTYDEAEKDAPKAVAGLMDLSARLYLRNHFGPQVMSMSLPWSMFMTMEENVTGSFLERTTWSKLLQGKSTLA